MSIAPDSTRTPPMREYPKVYSPYRRHTDGPRRNQIIDGDWTRPEFEYLADLPWVWTEKVDGTNVRAGWDGHRVSFAGRTDRAQLPATLFGWLTEHLPEELFEQAFGDTAAVLHGEGYGAGIQSGGAYRADQSFVLFDVRVGDWWLHRVDVEDVASKLGLDVVPLVPAGTLREAITLVGAGLTSAWGDFPAEGIVGVPPVGLLDRAGARIQVKVKAADFPGA